MEEGGVYYHDPSIPVGQITWQYTTVPVDYKFSDIKYEIIENLYLAEEEEDEIGETQLKNASIDYFDWVKLENEALKIIGNLHPDNIQGNTLKASKWNPSGTIQVWDNVMNRYVPVEGARVRARRWFTTKTDITDANGYLRTGSFRRDVNYSIKWERDDFDIRSGSYGQAYYNGPKMRGEWNLNIQQSGTPKSFLYAHIHRAAITYYYENWRWGIKTPPTRDGIFKFLQQRLHIGGKDKTGRSYYFTFNSFVQSAQVVVYANNYNSREIFGTTIHELAHASHWELGYSTGQYVLDALTSDPKLPESWAMGVEWRITNDVYPGNNYNHFYQDYTISQITSNEGYTPLAIDLMDTENQRNVHSGNTAYPNDRVEGYTLSQLEGALPGTLGSWWNWRTKIKEKYNNSTEEHVDYLFQTYN